MIEVLPRGSLAECLFFPCGDSLHAILSKGTANAANGCIVGGSK